MEFTEEQFITCMLATGITSTDTSKWVVKWSGLDGDCPLCAFAKANGLYGAKGSKGRLPPFHALYLRWLEKEGKHAREV